ncbi:MAG: response regulator transcription factor [Chloroflexi bacterium]|nr:response regulator transcription factor [Chloroflexota bacterium]
MEPLRILLADDRPLFRKGLAALLSSRGDLIVVGEASDGCEAVDRARELQPDLILMDIHMPNCDGLKATRIIKQEFPDIKIIMLTVSDDDESLFEAIKSGARGYLLKNLEPEQLFGYLEGVSRGEAPISPPMATKILTEFASQTRRAPAGEESKRELTQREREVLQLVTNGASNKEIAVRLNITENTVKNHLRNILEKLQLQNRVQIAAYAVREGLAKPDDAKGEPR